MHQTHHKFKEKCKEKRENSKSFQSRRSHHSVIRKKFTMSQKITQLARTIGNEEDRGQRKAQRRQKLFAINSNQPNINTQPLLLSTMKATNLTNGFHNQVVTLTSLLMMEGTRIVRFGIHL